MTKYPKPVVDGVAGTVEAVADCRRLALTGLQLMDDVSTVLACRADRPGPAVGRPQKHAPIGRLATAARVEDGSVEHDLGTLAVGAFGRGNDGGFDPVGVGIAIADRVGHPGARSRLSYLTTIVPVMFGWTEQLKVYEPAARAGTL